MNREEVAEVYERKLRHEIHHAEDNGHILASSCQGVGPGEFPPAIRSSNIEAAIEGARRELGLYVEPRTLYYFDCVACDRSGEMAISFPTLEECQHFAQHHKHAYSIYAKEV